MSHPVEKNTQRSISDQLSRCPICDSPHIGYTGEQMDAEDFLYRSVECKECNATWEEEYEFTRIVKQGES
jgi:DNA-directed RNA polymerase subunit M/transcription elongation factor TFIIS